MELTATYVVGNLELIGQENGRIAVRIKNCGTKTRVYGTKKVLGNHCEGSIYGEFSKDKIKLSHPVRSFAQGDKVKLIRHYGDNEDDDRYTLKNLTLASKEIAGLNELEPKSGEKPFSIDVIGTLLHIGWGPTKVYLRLKCCQKKLIFFDEKRKSSEKTETFEKEIYGEIPKDALRLDLCIETLAAYKKGDKVCLSRVEDGSFDFDNLTLSVCHSKPKYHSAMSL